MSAWLVAFALCSSSAWADEAAREAAMFGEQPEAEADTERRLLGALDASRDRLDVGGRLFLRALLTRGESLGATLDSKSAPALADVYLDSRPNERVRAYLRGRVTHEGVTDATAGHLDQLWIKFDVARTVYATVGRQHIKWGVGRVWNPTDFLMDVRDPLAILDERLGRTFVKLHVPVEAWGWNLYGVGHALPHGQDQVFAAAARMEALIGSAELAVTGHHRGDVGPWRAGADLSSALGPIDVLAEAATDGDSKEVRAVAGATWSFNYSEEDSATVGVEYLHNPRPEPLQPLYRAERAVAGYGILMAPGAWNDTTVIANAIHNVTDGDWIARLDWQVRVLTHLDVNLFGQRLVSPDFDTRNWQVGGGLRLTL